MSSFSTTSTSGLASDSDGTPDLDEPLLDKPLLALPGFAPTAIAAEGGTEEPKPRTLTLGESLSFAELGPIIIQTDGSTRRISNWESMTKPEQDLTWKRIKKRNEERLVVLRAQAAEAEKAEAETEGSGFPSKP